MAPVNVPQYDNRQTLIFKVKVSFSWLKQLLRHKNDQFMVQLRCLNQSPRKVNVDDQGD